MDIRYQIPARNTLLHTLIPDRYAYLKTGYIMRPHRRRLQDRLATQLFIIKANGRFLDLDSIKKLEIKDEKDRLHINYYKFSIFNKNSFYIHIHIHYTFECLEKIDIRIQIAYEQIGIHIRMPWNV
jgi:hypothetical protein